MPRVTFAVDDRPPPEPPPPDSMARPAPVDFQLNDVLDAVLAKDRDAFVDQYLRDKDAAVFLQPDMTCDINNHSTFSHLVVPQDRQWPITPPICCNLVTYHIPLDKARPCPKDSLYPQGSLLDPSILIRPLSPTTPFEFPFNVPLPYQLPDLGYNRSTYVPFESVTQVVSLP